MPRRCLQLQVCSGSVGRTGKMVAWDNGPGLIYLVLVVSSPCI